MHSRTSIRGFVCPSARLSVGHTRVEFLPNAIFWLKRNKKLYYLRDNTKTSTSRSLERIWWLNSVWLVSIHFSHFSSWFFIFVIWRFVSLKISQFESFSFSTHATFTKKVVEYRFKMLIFTYLHVAVIFFSNKHLINMAINFYKNMKNWQQNLRGLMLLYSNMELRWINLKEETPR